MKEKEETRERTVFVRVDDEGDPWTGEQMEQLVEAVDSVTPDDVGVLVTPADVEYIDSEQLKEHLEEIKGSM